MRFSSTVSTCRKAGCEDPGGLARRNCRQVGPYGAAPAVSPQRILLGQANGKAGDTLGRRRATGLALLARVVLLRRQLAVPGQQSRGRDREDLTPAPARYEPCQRSEPRPVNGLVSHPADLAAQHRVLVAQNQQLGVLGQITTEQHDQQPEHGTDDHVNKGEYHLG